MKKIALIAGTIAALVMLGAGCASAPTTPDESANTNNQSSTNQQTPTNTNTDANTNTAIGELKDLPTVAAGAAIDDSAWSTMTTKSGVTIKTPSKGATAPTAWQYSILGKDDAHLKGNCYLTDATVYQKTDGFTAANACQTTTELNAGPGERTDYFTFGSAPVQLITFTKKYPAGFDMDAYSAALEHALTLIK